MNETNTNTETQVVEGQETEKTYTQEQVNELLQKETDRRVTAALQKQEKKNAEKVREAEKLAKMNEEEKFKYELDQREAAIAAKEKELALMENKNEASKILAEKGLSLTLVDFVVAEDADTMATNIKVLEQAFKASVKAEVEKRMGGSTPKKTSAVNKAFTPEEFSKLPYSEMIAMKQQNPELWRQLNSQF